MVIDFHVHPPYWPEVTPDFVKFLETAWDPDEFAALREECRTGAGLARCLRQQGVDYAVILAEVNALTGRMDNRTVLELCRGESMLIPFGTLDPRREINLPAVLADLVAQGVRGIKLYPTYEFFYPNDRLLYPFYAKAEELGVPVMLHTGSSVFPGAKIKYGDPLLLDEVAVDFPRLQIVLSHAGRPIWYDRAEYMARFHENVYIDVAGLPPQNLLTYLPNAHRLTSKLIFGSDWPGDRTLEKNIDVIRHLPLPPDAIERILFGNAAKLLRLQDGAPHGGGREQPA